MSNLIIHSFTFIMDLTVRISHRLLGLEKCTENLIESKLNNAISFHYDLKYTLQGILDISNIRFVSLYCYYL